MTADKPKSDNSLFLCSAVMYFFSYLGYSRLPVVTLLLCSLCIPFESRFRTISYTTL